MRLPPEFKSAECPLRLGSPLRVPLYAWANWGIEWQNGEEYADLVRASECAYSEEWDWTTAEGHSDIAVAAQRAGLGDANLRLNEACGRLVAEEVALRRDQLRILDVGAGSGNTSLNILRATQGLPRPYVALLDPAGLALRGAASALIGAGLVEGQDFECVQAVDTEAASILPQRSFDVVVAVASLHHHADIVPAVCGLARVLRPQGLLIIGDWHNSLWEHPSRVLRLLEDCASWPGKKGEMEQFTALYPHAMVDNIERCSAMTVANKHIAKFWQAYAECRTTTEPQFMVLEGHRPPRMYLEAMLAAGLNPGCHGGSEALRRGLVTLSPGEEILSITIGARPRSREVP